MKTVGKATDLITFSRSSGGTALRKISYGPELVTNGDGSSTTDWSAARSNSTLTVTGGRLRATATASGAYGPVQTLTGLTIGNVYQVKADVFTGGGSGSFYFRLLASSTLVGSDPVDIEVTSDAGVSSEFVATATTMYAGAIHVASAGGDYIELDNISVKEVLFDQADGDLVVFNHPADIPRIEYDANGNVLGLLVEEARTNLLTYSEDFSNAAWSKTNITVTSNITTAPDGNTTADLLSPTSAGTSLVRQTPTVLSSQYTASVKVKKYPGSSGWFFIQLSESGLAKRWWFDLTTGSIGSKTGAGTHSITALPNDWYDCSVVFSASAGTCLFDLSGTTGDSFVTGDSVYAWGAQLEAGAFPTSYIPTAGSTATRAADVASIDTSAFGYRQDEGAVVVEGDLKDLNSHTFSLYGDSQNFVTLYQNNVTRVYSETNNVVDVLMTLGPTPTSFFKGGVGLKKNNVSATLDGGSVVTDTSCQVPVPSTLYIGIGGTPNLEINGHIKSIKYYPRRLTNAQLQELTT